MGSDRHETTQLVATLRGGLLGAGLVYALTTFRGIPLQAHTRSLGEAASADDVAGDFSLDQEKEVSRALLEASMVCIVVLLIAITILFEEAKEMLEESSDKNTKPIIKALFGEMTILGFLSACTFIIVKTPFPFRLSEYLFGEPELLVEVFEMVHFTLFFIMVCFVGQVLLLVRQSMKTEKVWEEMDRKCRNPASESDSNELKLFRALALEFVLERSIEPPFQPAEESQRVPSDFPFGRYMSICLGSNMARGVHVKPLSWGFFVIATLCFYEFMMLLHNDFVVISWVWSGIGWLVLFLTLLFQRYMRRVTEAFAGPLASGEQASSTPPEEQSLVNDSSSLPAWCNVDLESHLSKRSWFVKWISPETPSRQDVLFVFDAFGPEFHFLVLQVLFVFIGVYLALFFTVFAPEIWSEYNGSTWTRVVYVILSLSPVFILHLISDELLAEASVVGCIGTRRRPDVIGDVLRQSKTALTVRSFLVLDKIGRLTGENSAHHDAGVVQTGQLDSTEMEEVSKTFSSFDKNGDGTVSTRELERLMYAMGNPLTDDKLRLMLAELDTNQDGVVSKEEFLRWYENRVLGHHDNITIEEQAHALFHMFDKNGNGKISVGEFKSILDAFAIGFTVDEIGELVRELDEDGNTMIGEHEFLELLEKYQPNEHSAGH